MDGAGTQVSSRITHSQVSAALRENRRLLERAAARFGRCRPGEARDFLAAIIEFFDLHCRLADHAAGVEHDQSTLVDLLEFQELHEPADRNFIRRGSELLQYMLARMEFEKRPAAAERQPAAPLSTLMQYREARERLTDYLEVEDQAERYVMPLIRGWRGRVDGAEGRVN